MGNIRRVARILAVLTAIVLVWSGPAVGILAQDDAATSPGDQPLEIVVDGERFVFDRNVPVDLEALEEGTDDDGDPIFTKADDPFGAVYLPGDDAATAARYLPESLGSPDTICLGEDVEVGTITAGDDIYVPAGPEPDLGTDTLTEVGSTDDGRTIYAASAEQPFNELFADSDEGLIRYLLLTEDGAPVTFPDTVIFAGQEFEVVAGAEDPGTDGLSKVGCLGPFPALAEEGAEAPFGTLYLSVIDQVVTYQALDAPAETEPADEPAETEEPEATEPATPPADTGEAETGTITVRAAFCEADNSDNANSNCNGRVEAAEGTTVTFEVRAGEETEGDPLQTIDVEISQQGNGSRGESTGEALPLGVYTVCQVPVEGFDAVPSPGNQQGGNQGGGNQGGVEGQPCITTELTPGNTILQFNNFPAGTPQDEQAATPVEVTEEPVETVEATPTEVPPTEEPTPTEVPPTEEPTPTEVPPTEEPTPTEVPPTEAPAPTEVPPTDVPTEAPAPTAVPPTDVPPTEVPTEAPAPTEVPPTEAPAPTEAPSPTAVPPTAVPTAPADPAAPTAPAPTQPPAATQAAAETPADPAATATPPAPRPTPTPRVYQPRAVVPTVPPDAPPPAAATAPTTRCSGVAGSLDANGVPERLANSIQYGGTGYRFIEIVPVAEAGNLSLLGCVGPFEAYRGDAQDASRVLYLALPDQGDTLFRYEATASFNVTFEVSDNPRSLTLPGSGDQAETRYVASEPWVRSVYSSVTLILYVADPADAQPDRIYGRPVDADVIAEYVPEGSVEAVPEEVAAQAEEFGLQPDLTLGAGGPRYVLAAVWQPFGTTTNGWLTLYGPAGEAVPARLVGVDPRRLDLLIFEQAE